MVDLDDDDQGMHIEGGEDEGDGIVIDMSNTVESGGFEPLPTGLYDVVVDNLEFKKSQRSGNWMFEWTLVVQNGDYANRKLFYHTVFNDGGVGRVKRAIARLSNIDEDYKQFLLTTTEFKPKAVAEEGRLLQATCRAKVQKKKQDGEWRNNVQDLLPAPAEGFAES